ncbi:hydantoinase/oxoprolinase family protein [Streptomyces sp. NPDC055078]
MSGGRNGENVRRPQSPEGGRLRLAVDVGGTFIDLVMYDEGSGEVTVEKQPSSSADRADDFLAGLERLPERPADIDLLVHGTTVAINAVVQERGAKVGLLTTAGFRDVLAIGRGGRPEIYNFRYLPPEPLVPRYLRREVAERVAVDGSVLVPLDLSGLSDQVDTLLAEGVEAIVISFLHAYANPRHELLAAERVRAHAPHLPVTVSHQVVGEWREYERTSTAVMNGYVQPLFGGYLDTLVDRLRGVGYAEPLAIMQSNGGIAAAGRVSRLPVRTLMSGPAGGVIGAQALSRELGMPDIICADVGGTTYDVALIEGGRIVERSELKVDGRAVLMPSIDIVSIGAGGGSIASVDDLGCIQVGPDSAGADPGPACFGRGGDRPTVTDCHVLLGRLDTERFYGSRMPLDVAAAERAVREHVAGPAGLDPIAAARGVLAIAESNMTHAIRRMTVERGLDPRDFVLLSYGGGGGLFAAGVAGHLGVRRIVVPRGAANFSAWGMLGADYREDRMLTRVHDLDGPAARQLTKDLSALSDEVTATLGDYGFRPGAIDLEFHVDTRYRGQHHAVTVPLDAAWLGDADALVERVRHRFLELHTQLYGHGTADAPVEIVTARTRGYGRVKPVAWARPPAGRSPDPRTTRPVRFAETAETAEAHARTPVYDRDAIAPGRRISGPAVIEEWNNTVIVPPGWTAGADDMGNLELLTEETA